jgi:hypothetical protein
MNSYKDKLVLIFCCCVAVAATNIMSMPTEVWSYM